MITLLAALFLSHPHEPYGSWKTPDGAVLRMERCGAALCGRLMVLPPISYNPRGLDIYNRDRTLRGRPLQGVLLLQSFMGGPTKWTGGSAYNPGDGRTYSGRIELLDANTLKLTGCAFRIFCRSQTWKRMA